MASDEGSRDRARPLGRLTRWPLPDHDESIERLEPAARARVGAEWHRRIESEARAVSGFTVLAAALAEVGADEGVVGLARRAIDDEARHAELCRRVASAYLGREVEPGPPPPFVPPAYPGAPTSALPTLYAVAMCCLQETSSSTYIEACLRATTAPLAHAALRELLADEIDHARIGWAHLGSPCVSPETRAAVGPFLLPMARANFRFWWPKRDVPDDADQLAHGAGSAALGARAALASTRDLIAPGFVEAGFRIAAMDEWLESLRQLH